MRGVPYDRAAARRWPASRCASAAGRSTRTRATAASTPSRTRARRAARARGWTARGAPIPAATPLAAAAALLRAGAVVAVKGIGGYHLACRADDEAAVAALRARKQREDKPFALMARELDAARALVALDAADAALLTARERPIVHRPARAGARRWPPRSPRARASSA